MTATKLFRLSNGKAAEIPGAGFELERSLQGLIERNLEALLGVRFLASEHSTGTRHGGRIDSLGIDENGSPVIIEYKRSLNENVINQGLYYLDWLMDHKADFKLLVMDRLGNEAAEEIDWETPRLLCIAGDYTKYDEHAVEQINRNIELIRYRRFGDELLLFELVNRTSSKEAELRPEGHGPTASKTVEKSISDLDAERRDLYEALKAHLESLGDDVQVNVKKFYVAFKRLQNFACVEAKPTKGCLIVFVKVDPDDVELQEGFTRDVRNVGHYGTGGLEIMIRTRHDLDRAKPLLLKSYEAS